LAGGEGELGESARRRFELGAGVDALGCSFRAGRSGGCGGSCGTSGPHPWRTGGLTEGVTVGLDGSAPPREADTA